MAQLCSGERFCLQVQAQLSNSGKVQQCAPATQWPGRWHLVQAFTWQFAAPFGDISSKRAETEHLRQVQPVTHQRQQSAARCAPTAS